MILKERVAIVTGGGRGIGEAVARKLAEQGARVAIFDKNGERAAATASRIEAEAPEAFSVLPLQVDITRYDQVLEATGRVFEAHGRLDILVNNAGWDVIELFMDNKPEFWTNIIDLNLKGHINCCHCAIPQMNRSGGGKIVNISSDSGRVGAYGETVYAAAKGGLIAFTKSLAVEVAAQGICVNSVSPGPSETPMLQKGMQASGLAARILEERRRLIPLQRFARPEEIADAVLFFAGPTSDYITGQVLSVSGGLTMCG